MPNNHSLLFQLASRFLKYSILFTLGLGTICLLSLIFGALDVFTQLLAILEAWWWRLVMACLVLLGTAIVIESFR